MSNVLFFQNYAVGNMQDNIGEDCYRLRHKVFKERLNWRVKSYDRCEIDVFDNSQTWYAALMNREDKVVGTWRALPTTGDYMLKSVFPLMSCGERLPEDDCIWEISRFAIDKSMRTIPSGRRVICDESKALIQAFYDFSYQHNIKQLVAVTSVAAERMMKRLNVQLRRLGNGKTAKIGDVQTTCVLIDIPTKPKTITIPSTWSKDYAGHVCGSMTGTGMNSPLPYEILERVETRI